jgi:hypothetical protein
MKSGTDHVFLINAANGKTWSVPDFVVVKIGQ